ncbi:LrgB family protein [Polynucleobacter paneuropaeus]|jgi:predicted murein hydrolase (TIGR00659 family)|uniref:LrgB family protein n=1 Tax=Polynucleobacter paneuropaeus TaxID=2527775 RepID=A0AAE2YM74_9BURK|nr:LrgB family protein [Polynucleobacter paneuropaeus]AWW48206.1 LrgB family protein [Polynucleobacter paneuropaeus]MBT8514526.1 LrgB family protein [Polynucleobacter paneuropaeus]MBT8522333.1 LrgB family protein [Polynucleobacter paneuropaeus]MBT8525062.1 LrgB family protein [Polynucleobacter paneuropaeus]MBT8536126.1 LrgB family protein [Polynucleobacter paneuropaeus]
MTEKHSIVEIWVYLSGSPLFALFITLAAYQIGLWIYQHFKNNPLANPVAIAILLVCCVIQAIDMPYSSYFEGAQFIHFLLGSATVSLAIPIYRGLSSLKGRSFPLIASLITGGLVSIISGVGIAKLLGAGSEITGAMYPKSVTAPIAMGIAERIGVSPTLTAIFAVATGILGAILAPFVLNTLGMKAWWQRGFAIGIGAHGIGTSRAFSIHPEAGTYASLAMGMNGVISAIAIPVLYHLLNR